MNYIINPSWFYWLGVVESMHCTMFIGLVLSIVVIIASAFIIPMNESIVRDFPNNCDYEQEIVQFFTKVLKVAIGVCIVTGLFLVFVPSKKTLIEMMIAKQATYENATWTVDAVKSAVDYIIQAIQSLK